jgi:hypothetical protein
MKARKLMFVALAMLGMVVLAGTAVWAGCGSCGPKECHALEGTIKSVDAEARTIVLTTGSGDDAKDVTMKVCPKATITVAGKEAKLADVKAGVAATIKPGKPMKCGTKVAVGIAVAG